VAIVVQSPVPFARISTLIPVNPSVAIGATQRRVKPSALLSATNLDGASTVATAAVVALADALAEAESLADAEAVGAGVEVLALLEDFDQTIIPNKTIPTTTANTTRPDAPCFGATAAGLGATATGFGATADVTATAGVETLEAEDFFALFLTARFAGAFLATFLAALFLTTRFAVTFFAVFFAVRFAGAFLATLLAALFFTTRFAVDFFLATDFLAADFLAGAFLATFFAALFFFTAT